MAALYSRLEGDEDKPLPSLPSPTLTNPDMVLPDEAFTYTHGSAIRPPVNNGYLRDESIDTRSLLATPPRDQQREKRGLMSRKMMLVRSQTGSSNGLPYSVPREESTLPMASSPLLHDQMTVTSNGTGRRGSNSSIDSEEMAKMPDFLQKYRNMDLTEDEMTDAEGLASDMNTTYDEQRRAKEEEEQVSALLSKRAEEILANAKKRLNLMEGNLRGARDLVAPLTAANLKRATSLSHSFGSPSLAYAHRRLESITYDPDPYNPSRRMLQSQASSPTMRHDYLGHARAGSDFDLERPHTSMSRSRFPIRTPDGRSPDTTHNPPLRSARSYDSFGLNKLTIPRDTKSRSKNSPDSSLEPVSEDDGPQHIETSYRNSFRAPEVVPAIGLGVSHAAPPSIAGSTASEDLRDQMANLKGRISSLRERAREDSLRRASASNLRNPSPFNSASHDAPDMWYNESSRSGSQGSGSPATPQFPPYTWSHHAAPTGSRNAFAELAARQQRSNGGALHERQYNEKYRDADTHKRTSSGTAIIDPANKHFTHHKATSSVELPGAYPDTDIDDSEEYDNDAVYEDASQDEISTEFTDEDEDAEAEEDSYAEEAVDNPHVVAHEDREDAFDYEHFFLHSAMGSYNAGRITPDSELSDESSASSIETARAPRTAADDEDEYYNDEAEEDVPRAPGTPDELRQIEARLQHQHERTISTESISTLNTFATANEDGRSRSVSRSRNVSRSTSRLSLHNDMAESSQVSRPALPEGARNSIASRGGSRLDFISSTELARPGTAMREHTTTLRTPTGDLDDNSDRADSGVGGLAAGRVTPKPAANATSAVSAPSSPAASADPTAVAVKALLDPAGQALSTKDSAVLSDLIESLRRVCVRLQEEDQYEGKVLRRRLDDARRILDGLGALEHDV